MNIDDTDLTRRAFAAYFRSGDTEQPSSTSGVREIDGKNYVAVENVNGLLAVYRVTNQGQLRRMKRWPKELED